MKQPTIISRKYHSGFKAEVLLRPHFNQRFFGIIIDFGSSDPQKIPGSAHFLEHKLFAKKDGDLSHEFEQLGADVNAFTSFNETMFYCSGVDHNRKLIELLFRLVGEPYFTKENIAQEEPIIAQELAMYQDEPNWAVNNALMQEMFGDSNLGSDVAGTKESLARINLQSLNACYQENYVAGKMQFVACGDFSDYQIKTILRQVGKLQKQYLKEADVKKTRNQKNKGKMQDVLLPSKNASHLFGLGLRLPNFKKVLSSFDLAQILLQIMLESKLSVTSPWFERMRRANLLSNSLQITVNYTRQGNFATIFGISSDSQKVIQAIKKELQKPLIQSDQIYLQQFFALKKKEWLAQAIRSLNDLSYLAVETAEESLDGENLFATADKLQMMTVSKLIKYCDELMKNCELCSVSLRKDEK